jgi:hypothetical protein
MKEHGMYIEWCTENIDAPVLCIKHVQVFSPWELQERGLIDEMGFILEGYYKRYKVK